MSELKVILKELGGKIKAIRKQKRMTQLDLEVSSGVHAGDISKIENGMKNPAATTLIKLASALEVELNEFYPIKRSEN
ncbi:helix-turn-helix domain-containing protein [Chitinophaga silvisoli]|jgi:transcriptional regulator with XRE-family HTH domain|uniref:XRE family transcriptional regulator n=1 Tax=Chitinophaga silvisoli TaxID=2291814 RepID=A0A3E1NXP5_9BACT|nr:helix-turn-helix transcriptional regulator [Chitinophaga silvisoli]RFM32634.1 XRE family transcriptional regulator [Chitinophaga silvisoli]